MEWVQAGSVSNHVRKNLACFEGFVGWNMYIKNAFGGVSDRIKQHAIETGEGLVVIKWLKFVLVFCGKYNL